MTSKEIATVTRSLDHVSDKFLLYVEKRAALKRMQFEVDKLENEIRHEVGTADEATILGETVISNKLINKFKEGEFKNDNPLLHKEFIRPMVVEKFDQDAFREQHPNLYTQYQSRQFRLLEK